MMMAPVAPCEYVDAVGANIGKSWRFRKVVGHPDIRIDSQTMKSPAEAGQVQNRKRGTGFPVAILDQRYAWPKFGIFG
jgi:hypothetical protein